MAGPRHQHIEVGGGTLADFIEEVVRTFNRSNAGRFMPDGTPPRPESMSERIASWLISVFAQNRHKERFAIMGCELEFEGCAIGLKTRRPRTEPQFRLAF